MHPALVILLLAAWAQAWPGDRVEVHLRPQVQVASTHVRVGDVAEVLGPPDLAAALAARVVVAIGPQALTVDGRMIRATAGDPTLTVSGTCVVRQPQRVVTVEELVAAARTAVCLPGEIGEASVLRPPSVIAFGDDGGDIAIAAESLDRQRIGDVPVRVRILRRQEEIARTLVTLRVRRQIQGVVVLAPVRRGSIVGADAVSVARIDVGSATGSPCTALDQVVGRQATRDLAPGQAVLPSMIEPPLDVRPGQALTLVWRSGGIELTAAGESLAAGRCGDVVPVRRTADERRIRAQVIGPGLALVNW